MREIHRDKGQYGYDHNNEKFPYQIGSEVVGASRAEIEPPEELASLLLDGVAYMVRASGGVVNGLGNSLSFQAGSGRTYVEVRDVHTLTIDKHEVSHVVLIRTELPAFPIEDRGLVVMNTLASLGALVREGN